MKIVRIENYRNDEGLLVEVQHEVVEGQFMALPTQTSYWAKVHINTPDGPTPLDVPLQCKDIHEAFEVFKQQVQANGEEAFRKLVKKMQAEAKRQQIAQGGRMQLPPLNG